MITEKRRGDPPPPPKKGGGEEERENSTPDEKKRTAIKPIVSCYGKKERGEKKKRRYSHSPLDDRWEWGGRLLGAGKSPLTVA